MNTGDAEDVRAAVRDHYGQLAMAAGPCCGDSCCGAVDSDMFGAALYSPSPAEQLPAAALAASLGCGNPTAMAELEPGQVVLDLGCGGGIDVLLAARRVGPSGRAYGLDMTPQMLELAERNRAADGVVNVEFLAGTIEAVPLPAGTVDVIISNCVVNLSPDKPAVFAEAFRVLRPGGRLAISDIVLDCPLPPAVGRLVGMWTGCVAGALTSRQVLDQLTAAGFVDVVVEPTRVLAAGDLRDMVGRLDPATVPAGVDVEDTIVSLDGAVISAFIRGVKPH